MDMEIVNSYVAKLRATLGDEDAFSLTCYGFEHDKHVRQQEAVAIAKAFYGDAKSKISKSEALRLIWKKQYIIMDSRAKTRAQGNKSAA